MRSDRFALAVAALALAMAASPASADGLFAALDGAWRGSGNVKLENGKTERLKCTGYYNAKGSGLSLAINCGNPSFKINMRANLTSVGGQISGTWEEREFNQVGDVTGKATGDRVSLAISGAISGSMSITMAGNGQTVSITTGGPGFTGVDLQFAKSS